MSKLRADITYSHRLQSNISLPTVQTIISEVESFKHNKITQEETENENTNSSDNSQIIENELNEETEVFVDSEEDFGNYLQGWADMLEEEKKGFDNENFEEISENDVFLELENITHPAIDINAKWELASLFKELDLPF